MVPKQKKSKEIQAKDNKYRDIQAKNLALTIFKSSPFPRSTGIRYPNKTGF
jgi:hypothetical protein